MKNNKKTGSVPVDELIRDSDLAELDYVFPDDLIEEGFEVLNDYIEQAELDPNNFSAKDFADAINEINKMIDTSFKIETCRDAARLMKRVSEIKDEEDAARRESEILFANSVRHETGGNIPENWMNEFLNIRRQTH